MVSDAMQSVRDATNAVAAENGIGRSIEARVAGASSLRAPLQCALTTNVNRTTLFLKLSEDRRLLFASRPPDFHSLPPSELLIDGISASDQDPDSGVELGARPCFVI